MLLLFLKALNVKYKMSARLQIPGFDLFGRKKLLQAMTKLTGRAYVFGARVNTK